MSNYPLILVGAGGHARSCIDVLEQAGYAIHAVVGMASEVGGEILGYPISFDDSALAKLLEESGHALVGIGQTRTAEPRIKAYLRLCELGFRMPPVISPLAHVSRHAEIGPGTIIMHGAVVNAGARVGANCILNSFSLVEHDAEVADHCHISTRAVLNGDVRVGRASFVGSGAVTRHGIRIGEGCFVGMGSLVLEDCEDGKRVLPMAKTYE